MSKPRQFVFLAFLIGLCAPSAAQSRDSDVPYWASIRADVVNMRVGPSLTYHILWVYRRKHLPVKVVRLMEGWRLVEDPDGARGWLLGRFLTRSRSAIVKGKGLADMRESADPNSRLLWRVEPGVVGMLGDCESGWCELDIGGRKGYVRQARLWGPGKP